MPEQNDLSQARKLIGECWETKNTYLDLGNCGITDLNDLPELFECTHLKSLNLSSNQIIDIRSLSSLIFLKSLLLRNNNISNISSLTPLISLKYLDLNSNSISNVNSIASLKFLRYLFLSENKISDISALPTSGSLKRLKLRDNFISDISIISQLNSLRYLDVRSNRISKIPRSLFKTNLGLWGVAKTEREKGLMIQGNPVISPPLEILNRGRRSVLDWFEADKVNLNDVKIILIGDPDVGKTSLLRRFTQNEFNETGEVQTDGINIEDIIFGESEQFIKQTALHNITGHFWDFGGQEIMSATHNLFLSKRCVYRSCLKF